MSNDMQIIIPMTGYGSRFQNAGYNVLKPFIEVHGKPMIEWVVKMFQGDEDKILFICRQEHINSFEYMREELNRIAPKARIFTIKDWEKKGPAHDILLAENWIKENQPVLVSYCDYYMHWDYDKFKEEVLVRDCEGAVPCYSSFHPHLIPEKNLYASCKVDENENLIKIKEKFSWEKNKLKTRHSPGVYYFKNKFFLKQACQEMIQANDHIKGEFYMSLPYNYLVQKNLKVWCPINVSHFCQWGTPEDLQEYLFWVNEVKGVKE